VDADGAITGADETAANNVAMGNATGFAAFQLLNPVIVGDVAGDFSVDAGDVSTIDAFVSDLNPLQIPVPAVVGTFTYESAANPIFFANPGAQNNFVNDSVSVLLAATESSAATFTYSQSGLPTGLSLNSSTGLISGTIDSGDTPGNYTIQVSVTNGVSTVSQTFTWSINGIAGALDHFLISPVATSVPKNAPLTFTVTAQDAHNLLLTNYAGTVTITNSPDSATPTPSSAALTNGVGIFSITFAPSSTPSTETITATSSSITGTATIKVNATGNAVDHFKISAPSDVTAGVPFPVTVTALTSGGALADGYTGSVHISDTFSGGGSQSVLPSDATLTNGVGIFFVTLKTATRGTSYWTITAAGPSNSPTVTSGKIAVNASTATHFTVTPTNVTVSASISTTSESGAGLGTQASRTGDIGKGCRGRHGHDGEGTVKAGSADPGDDDLFPHGVAVRGAGRDRHGPPWMLSATWPRATPAPFISPVTIVKPRCRRILY
jgi:hypothetical protein